MISASAGLEPRGHPGARSARRSGDLFKQAIPPLGVPENRHSVRNPSVKAPAQLGC